MSKAVTQTQWGTRIVFSSHVEWMIDDVAKTALNSPAYGVVKYPFVQGYHLVERGSHFRTIGHRVISSHKTLAEPMGILRILLNAQNF